MKSLRNWLKLFFGGDRVLIWLEQVAGQRACCFSSILKVMLNPLIFHRRQVNFKQIETLQVKIIDNANDLAQVKPGQSLILKVVDPVRKEILVKSEVKFYPRLVDNDFNTTDQQIEYLDPHGQAQTIYFRPDKFIAGQNYLIHRSKPVLIRLYSK